MSRSRVIFRADGNSRIGLGHIARSLALAEMLSPEFDCVFASVNPSESALALIGAAFPVVIIPAINLESELYFLTCSLLTVDDVVVLDGYKFNTQYQQQIRSVGCRLICIDDLNAWPFVADAVINHAPSVDSGSYQVRPYTQLCFGFDYALLRKPFLDVAEQLCMVGKLPERKKSHILLTFGGADKHNLCEKLVHMCLAIPEVEKIAVVLGAGSNKEAFTTGFAAHSEKVKAYSGLSAEEMCALMLSCGTLLAPASTVVMEGFATGIRVMCGYYVPEQKQPYEKLLAEGCITPAGNWNTITEAELRLALANLPETPKALIDGQQPHRFRKLFSSLR